MNTLETARGEYPGMREIYRKSFPTSLETPVDAMLEIEDILTAEGRDEQSVMKIGNGMEEVVMNAVVHGHLRLQRTAENTVQFGTVVLDAIANLQQPSKQVEVVVFSGSDEIVITVQDEGVETKEFWLNRKNNADGEINMKESGRGEIIEKAAFDTVSYEKNDRGLKVTLRKKFNA